MEIGKFKAYRGIVGTIEMTDGELHGRLDINGFVNYMADSLEELEQEYHKAIDDYLDFLNN